MLVARLAGWMPPPRPWSAAARRRTGQVMACLAAASELFADKIIHTVVITV